MTQNKNKINMLPVFLKVVATALRGIAKGFPVVNAIIEAKKNAKTQKAIEAGVGEVVSEVAVNLKPSNDAANPEVTLPHNWLSIVMQLITTSIIIYCFFTKQITADSVIALLKQLTGLN